MRNLTSYRSETGHSFGQRNKTGVVLAVLLFALSPIAGYALGLGKLQVDSGLGEPLRLQIQLESVTANEAETLDVILASRSDFARAGIDYPDLASLLNFELISDPGGRYRVLVSTEEPLQDAYLHFLVSAVWSGGKAVREYTALLDPPLYSGKPATSVTLTGESAAGEAVADEIAAQVAAAEKAEQVSSSAAPAAGATRAADGTVLVRKGDTLSQIVEDFGRPADVDYFRALEAIYRKNPQAFIENNMNLLRSGASLKLPSAEEMRSVSRRESLASFTTQLEKFNEYRNVVQQRTATRSSEALTELIEESEQAEEVSVGVELPPLSPEDLGAEQETPIATTDVDAEAEPTEVVEAEAVESVAVETAAEEEARLTIGQQVVDSTSTTPGGSESNAELDALRQQLAQLDESMLASGVESDSVKQNLKQIQDQVERMSTLIQVEDSNLAQAQNRAAAAGEEAGENLDVAETLENASNQAARDAATQDAVSELTAGSAEEALIGADSGGQSETDLIASSSDPLPTETEVAASTDNFASVDAAVDPEASVDQDPANETEQAQADEAAAGSEEVAASEDVASSEADSADAVSVDTPASDTDVVSTTESSDDEQAAEVIAAQTVADTAGDGGGDQASIDPEASGEDETGVSAAVRTVSSSGFLDSFKGMFSALPEHGLKIALALLALLGGLFLWQRKKSQREYDESMLDIETEEVSMNSEASIQKMSDASGIDLASANDSALELTIGGGMSYLSEEGIAGVNEEDNEVIKAGAVDPLAEADVYLAYDRDEQAVQVLKEAFADAPERGELAEKLLEIYHKQDDRRSFDALATEMQRRSGTTTNFSWDKVVAMGREVSPGNALYEGGSPMSSGSSEPVVMDLDDDIMKELEESSDSTQRPVDKIDSIDVNQLNMVEDASENSVVQGLEVDDLDFDIEAEIAKDSSRSNALDAPTLSQIISENADDELNLDDTIAMDMADKAADEDDDDEDDDDEEISIGGEALNLDFGDDEKSDQIDADVKHGVALKKETVEDKGKDKDEDEDDDAGIDALSGMSEMSEASMGKLEPYHESETALELAKAYMELGEQEIAKGFIEEVLTEGSDKQKGKARKLIKELAS